jgi:hypothetical protein
MKNKLETIMIEKGIPMLLFITIILFNLYHWKVI